MNLQLDLGSLWTPKITQQKCLKALQEAEDLGSIAYVGALGSGKTWILCRAAIGLCLEYPGWRCLIGRFYGTDLRDTTMETFFTLVSQVEESLRAQVGEGVDPRI